MLSINCVPFQEQMDTSEYIMHCTGTFFKLKNNFSLHPGWGLSSQGQVSSSMGNSSTYFYSKRFDSFHAEDSRASDQMASLPIAGATGLLRVPEREAVEVRVPAPLPLLSIPAALVLIRCPALRARRWLLSHPLMVSESRAGASGGEECVCLGHRTGSSNPQHLVKRDNIARLHAQQDRSRWIAFYSAAPGRS